MPGDLASARRHRRVRVERGRMLRLSLDARCACTSDRLRVVRTRCDRTQPGTPAFLSASVRVMSQVLARVLGGLPDQGSVRPRLPAMFEPGLDILTNTDVDPAEADDVVP